MDKDTFFEKKRFINTRGKLLDLKIPRVMGILNVTPDSFYDGGFYQKPAAIIKRVNDLLTQDADIVDIGACSSRPGAKDISCEEELKRLCTALELIRKEFPEAILSVDTSRAAIAKKVVQDFHVDMINDISGGMLDAKMPETIAELQVPYVMMHMPGNPRNMQEKTQYKDVVAEVIKFLAKQSELFKSLGVNDLIVDPGFGFGKTIEQNFNILYRLADFRILDLPLMVGLSRKSMIYRFLDSTPEQSLNGTTALHMMALERGADILRTHDVREAKETIHLHMKARQEGVS